MLKQLLTLLLLISLLLNSGVGALFNFTAAQDYLTQYNVQVWFFREIEKLSRCVRPLAPLNIARAAQYIMAHFYCCYQ